MNYLQKIMDESLSSVSTETFNLTSTIEKSLYRNFFKKINVLATVLAVVICFSLAAPIFKTMHNAAVAVNGWDITVNEELKTIEIRK